MSKNYVSVSPKSVWQRISVLTVFMVLIGAVLWFLVPIGRHWKTEYDTINFLLKNNALDYDSTFSLSDMKINGVPVTKMDMTEVRLRAKFRKKTKGNNVKLLKGLVGNCPEILRVSGDWTEALKAVPEFDATKVKSVILTDRNACSILTKPMPNLEMVSFRFGKQYSNDVAMESGASLERFVELDLAKYPVLKQINELEINAASIKNFDEVSKITGLSKLTLSATKFQLSDPFLFPKELSELEIGSIKSFDLGSLKNAKNLELLSVKANKFSNSSKDLSFPNLRILKLYQKNKSRPENGIRFAGKVMEHVELTGFTLDSFAEIGPLATINTIQLENMNIKDWSGFEKLSVGVSLKVNRCSRIPKSKLPALVGLESIALTTEIHPILDLNRIKKTENLGTLAFDEVSDFQKIVGFANLYHLQIEKQDIEMSMVDALGSLDCGVRFGSRSQMSLRVRNELRTKINNYSFSND